MERETPEDPEPTQSYEEMMAPDGYIEDGVADPGSVQELDTSDPDVMGELHIETAMDLGYMEDRETERDTVEDRVTDTGGAPDPLDR